MCQSTDVTSALSCPWWWRSNCSELTRSPNSHSLTRCFFFTTLLTLCWGHTRPIISSEYLMNSKSESLHLQKFTFLFFQSFHGSDPSVQLHNCYHFLTNWMSAFPNRGIYHTGMVFCRCAARKKCVILSKHLSCSDLSTSVTPLVWSRRAPSSFTWAPASSSPPSYSTSWACGR